MEPKQTHLLVNTDEKNFVREKHICYYTEESKDEIILVQVVERLYKHPECPDFAMTPIIETRNIKRVKRTSAEAGALVLLEANQKAVWHQEKLKEN